MITWKTLTGLLRALAGLLRTLTGLLKDFDMPFEGVFGPETDEKLPCGNGGSSHFSRKLLKKLWVSHLSRKLLRKIRVSHFPENS